SPPGANFSSFFADVTAAAVADQSISCACHSAPFSGDVRDQKRILRSAPTQLDRLARSSLSPPLLLEQHPCQLAAHPPGTLYRASEVTLIDRLADQLLLVGNKCNQRFTE